MKIEMLKNEIGSDENAFGVNLGPTLFEAGKTYNVCDNLAKGFVSIGSAKPVLVKSESKQTGPAPENKMATKPSKNKAK